MYETECRHVAVQKGSRTRTIYSNETLIIIRLSEGNYKQAFDTFIVSVGLKSKKRKRKEEKKMMTDRRMTRQAKHQPMRALNSQLCNYAAKDRRPGPTHDHFILTTLK